MEYRMLFCSECGRDVAEDKKYDDDKDSSKLYHQKWEYSL